MTRRFPTWPSKTSAATKPQGEVYQDEWPEVPPFRWGFAVIFWFPKKELDQKS
jgi:hypothetical protein